jgi:hypothetical protein
MSLTSWRAAGWLVEHKTTPEEVRELFAVAERDLKDSAVAGISPDTQLGLAYNAALQLCTAALAAAGYRASRERKHYLTLQSAAHTIEADAKLVARLDAFRKKRNVSDYERVGLTSSKEAAELREMAKDLRDRVRSWIERSRPELLEPK